MADGRGTSEGRFILELDGISAIRATECNGVGLDHTPFELFESNRAFPRLGRSHFKANEITIKHATSLNNTGSEVWDWAKSFMDGSLVERLTFRLIKLDEDGESPVETWECYDCVPLKFESENAQAGGNNAAYFRFTFRPEDVEFIA